MMLVKTPAPMADGTGWKPRGAAVAETVIGLARGLRRLEIPEAIQHPGVIAIGNRLEAGDAADVGAALSRGGIRAFEIALDGVAGLETIGELSRRHGADDELLIGAGNVRDEASAMAAVQAGARFLALAQVDESVIRLAVGLGIPVFPEAFSPAEILAAWQAGATAVKLFPASVVGPAFVREFRGPFPEVALIPVGGVGIESAAAFIAVGAVAVGLGRALVGSNLGTIEDRSRRVVESIRKARKGGVA